MTLSYGERHRQVVTASDAPRSLSLSLRMCRRLAYRSPISIAQFVQLRAYARTEAGVELGDRSATCHQRASMCCTHRILNPPALRQGLPAAGLYFLSRPFVPVIFISLTHIPLLQF